MSETTFPRAFVVQRDADVSGVSGKGIIAEGVLFSDGWAVTHWLDKPPMHEPKTDVWHNPGVQPFERVHGHGGATRVVWEDELAEQRARMASLVVEAFDVPAQILGAEAERALLYQQLTAALGNVWRTGRARFLTQTDCGKYADAVMPVVEQLLEQRDRARRTVERVCAVGPELEYEATAPGMAEPAREVLRDASRRIRVALDDPEQHSQAAATEATQQAVCDTYLPPAKPEDSGFCSRCGMYDYRHRTDTKERP